MENNSGASITPGRLTQGTQSTDAWADGLSPHPCDCQSATTSGLKIEAWRWKSLSATRSGGSGERSHTANSARQQSRYSSSLEPSTSSGYLQNAEQMLIPADQLPRRERFFTYALIHQSLSMSIGGVIKSQARS